MDPSPETGGPNPVDLHVGGRVRMRRKLLGLSQDELAQALKLTFQQVQKYERGANRISASKLYAIARALGVGVAYFFDGLPDLSSRATDGAPVTADRLVTDFLATPEGLELARLFPQIDKPGLRRRILDLVRSMSDAP